jgi:membrane protease YdiL (CAAX protease family)
MPAVDRPATRNVIEIALVAAVIATYLWFGRRSSTSVDVAFAATLLAVLACSHRRAGEGLRAIGFRTDTLAAAIRLLLPIVLVCTVLIVVVGLLLAEMHFPPLAKAAQKLVEFLALGIAQQYVLLGFVFGRVERIAGAEYAPVLAALLFALLHLPNSWLTAVTFTWGVIACLVYRKAPNLWANGVAHGLLAALVYYALPRSVTSGLHVGMEYFASLSG